MAFPDWKDRVEKNVAKRVRDTAKHIGTSESEKGCFWSIYLLDGTFYIGLCDFPDIWEIDESTAHEYCKQLSYKKDLMKSCEA